MDPELSFQEFLKNRMLSLKKDFSKHFLLRAPHLRLRFRISFHLHDRIKLTVLKDHLFFYDMESILQKKMPEMWNI